MADEKLASFIGKNRQRSARTVEFFKENWERGRSVMFVVIDGQLEWVWDDA